MEERDKPTRRGGIGLGVYIDEAQKGLIEVALEG
jgi:hypothetical protein